MKSVVVRAASLAAIVLVVAAPALHAYWIADGIGICTLAQTQNNPSIASDGAGGAIIVWQDRYSGTFDIYAQRVNAAGDALWQANGMAICTAADDQMAPKVVSDGSGGALIAWNDRRSGNDDIYAQRVSASGTALWGANGLAVCTAANIQNSQAVAHDGAGGAIVVWMDMRGGGSSDLYAQRVNAIGAVQWTADGVAVCTATASQSNPRIQADGSGGAIIAWLDGRAGNNDIYAQRASSMGSFFWGVNGLAICTTAELQDTPELISDGAGGAIVAWKDSRNGSYDVYAQRVSSPGAVQWAANGVAVCSFAGSQIDPKVASDGAGGAIVVWSDSRSPEGIYAQRLNSSGTRQWTANGIAICATSAGGGDLTACSDGAGGAIAVWRRYVSGNERIQAQRVSVSGGLPWGSTGALLRETVGAVLPPAAASDGAGGAIAAWPDYRTGESDIRAQLVDSSGRPGFLAPDIAGVIDVPGDQGRSVYLSWYAARADRFMDSRMSHYTIWRSITQAQAELAMKEGAPRIESLSELEAESVEGAIRIEEAGALDYFWQLVGTHDALYMGSYGVAVATLFDSTAACDDYHYFQVVGHTTDPRVFWTSAPDSGRSVDNLAPCPPASFAGERNVAPLGLSLTWDPNSESDFSCYALYRGLSADFVPGAENLVARLDETAYFDGEWNWGSGYYYKLSAFDVNGNESAFALFGPEDVTGDETPKAPAASYLAQNFPNPFNPATRIEFGLAARANVRLRIYDASGRLVRTLADGAFDAGRYVRVWDGRDSRGTQVASGIYFYRLDAGAFAETKKMILLK